MNNMSDNFDSDEISLCLEDGNLDTKKMLRKLKKEYEKKLSAIQSKYKEKSEHYSMIEKDNKELRNKLFEKENASRKRDEEFSLLEEINIKLEQKIQDLKLELQRNNKDNIIVQKEKIHKQYRKAIGKNQRLLRIRQEMNRQIFALDTKLKINESLERPNFMEEMIDLTKTLNGVKSELKSYKNKYLILEKEHDKLKADYNNLLKVKQNTIEQKKQEQPLPKGEKQEHLGYFSVTNSECSFITLNNIKYLVQKPPQNIKDKSPGKVVIRNNRAYVLEIFDHPFEKQTTVAIRSNEQKINTTVNVRMEDKKKEDRFVPRKMKQKPKEKYVQFGDFSVLIVGSRSRNIYINRLKEHGVQAVWHNPYEESFDRLQDKFNSADIVIICTSHTSHPAIESIDKKNPKVEEIEKDSMQNIIARVRYKAIQLGILQEKMQA